MKILVAGGAGFLGTSLVEKYLSPENQITVIDNFATGRAQNLDPIKNNITFIKADVSELKDVEGKFDLVLNLAARVVRMDWEANPVEIMLPNSIGNMNLIKIALKNDAKYLFTSTSEVYGDPKVLPTPETYLAERFDHLGSRAPYDESKRFGETLIKAYEREYGLKSVIVRLFNSYGPRLRGGAMQGRVITRMIELARKDAPIEIYGDGGQTRAFTYVDDTIDGIKAVIDRGEIGEIYNVGNDKETKIIDLANMIIELTGSKSEIVFKPLPPGDPGRRQPDITKIRKIGWEPKVGLREGLEQMVKLYKSEE